MIKDFLAIGKTRDRIKGKDVIYHFNDIVNCIHTSAGYSSLNMGVFIAEFNMSRHDKTQLKPMQDGVSNTITPVRIRKLTPRECFRLMGVSEPNIDKIQNAGISNSQQYKMARNSIVVDVLEHIFRKLFLDTGQESQQLSLF